MHEWVGSFGHLFLCVDVHAEKNIGLTDTFVDFAI